MERIRNDASYAEEFQDHVLKILQAREMGYSKNSVEFNTATAWEMYTPRASQVWPSPGAWGVGEGAHALPTGHCFLPSPGRRCLPTPLSLWIPARCVHRRSGW